MKQKLTQLGLVPENNFRNFQTYIQLERGYTFEFYDFKKICSKLKDHENFTKKNNKIGFC